LFHEGHEGWHEDRGHASEASRVPNAEGSGGLKDGLLLLPILVDGAPAVRHWQEHHPRHSAVAQIAAAPEEQWKAAT
jgi:hypothetical protein